MQSTEATRSIGGTEILQKAFLEFDRNPLTDHANAVSAFDQSIFVVPPGATTIAMSLTVTSNTRASRSFLPPTARSDNRDPQPISQAESYQNTNVVQRT